MPFAAINAQANIAAQSSALCQSFTTYQRDRNAYESRDGCQGVGAMMPGVSLNRGAFGVSPDANDVANKVSLD